MRAHSKSIPTPDSGKILKEEFLEPLGISAYRLARELNVSTSSILDILHNKRKLTIDMALRFSRYFGTSEKFWMNLQNDIELRNRRVDLKEELSKITPVGQSV